VLLPGASISIMSHWNFSHWSWSLVRWMEMDRWMSGWHLWNSQSIEAQHMASNARNAYKHIPCRKSQEFICTTLWFFSSTHPKI